MLVRWSNLPYWSLSYLTKIFSLSYSIWLYFSIHFVALDSAYTLIQLTRIDIQYNAVHVTVKDLIIFKHLFVLPEVRMSGFFWRYWKDFYFCFGGIYVYILFCRTYEANSVYVCIICVLLLPCCSLKLMKKKTVILSRSVHKLKNLDRASLPASFRKTLANSAIKHIACYTQCMTANIYGINLLL